jgi:glutathione peroxidase
MNDMGCTLCKTGIALAVTASLAIGAGSMVLASEEPTPATAAPSAYVLGYEMPLLEGGVQDLGAFKGKVVLIVNTASKCGLTPQYKELQALYDAKKDDGLVILGFPANNFMNQEPGSNEQIAEFCEQNYGVTFPMFSKVSVKGDDICPLYKQLTAQPSPIGGEIQWNFDKFLVDRDGNVVARFSPRTKPSDPAFNAKIQELLAREG